jgi:DNA end-binding protein Ku
MSTAVLRVRDDVLVLQTMMWPDEVRKPDFGTLGATEDAAKPQELKMARMLVDTLAGDYDPDEYEDDYASAVEALVRAKLEGGEVTHLEKEEPKKGEVVDLLAALQRSVEAAKTSRGETASASDEEEAEPAAEEPAAKKTAAKKAPAKKAPTKKAPAKKTAAKKTTAKKSAKKAS